MNKGCFELPTNATLRDVVMGCGGGVPEGRKLKAIQLGGSSCGYLTESQLDMPADFESMRSIGASLGSGAVLVIDDSHSGLATANATTWIRLSARCAFSEKIRIF